MLLFDISKSNHSRKTCHIVHLEVKYINKKQNLICAHIRSAKLLVWGTWETQAFKGNLSLVICDHCNKSL